MEVIIFKEEVLLQQIILFAERLGEKELIILFEKHSEENREILKKIEINSSLKTALLIKNTKEAMRAKGKYDFVFGLATRELIENNVVDYVYSAEILEEKDKTHRRGSGLNHVLAKLIFEKKKTYVYDLSMLLKAKNQATVLGRMKQNKKILSKYRCKQVCCSFAQENLELRALKERTHFLEQI